LRASLAYFFKLQMINGAVFPNPESMEKPSHLMFEIIAGLVQAAECLPDQAIRESLHGLVAYRITPESGDPDKLFNNEKGYWLLGCSPWYICALGAYLGRVVQPTAP
jgi:hypothetical protein